jgi:hypothetical protein
MEPVVHIAKKVWILHPIACNQCFGAENISLGSGCHCNFEFRLQYRLQIIFKIPWKRPFSLLEYKYFFTLIDACFILIGLKL